MYRRCFSHKGALQPASAPASVAMSALDDDSDNESLMVMACHALEQEGILGVNNESCQPVQTVGLTAQTGEAGDESKKQELPAPGADPAIAKDLWAASVENSGGCPELPRWKVLLPEAETLCGGEQKRRRQLQKPEDCAQGSGEPPAAQPDLSDGSDDGPADRSHSAAAFFALRCDRARRNVIGNRLRRRGWYKKWQETVNKKQKRTRTWPERWSELPAKAKQEFVKWWLEQPDCGLCESIAAWTKLHFIDSQPDEPTPAVTKLRFRSSGPQLLLTYQGAWGEITCVGIVSPPCIEALPALLRKQAQVQQLWERIQREVEGICQTHNCNRWGISVEICPQTLAETGKVRLHVHLALARSGGRFQPAPASLQLLDTKPHTSGHNVALARKGRAALDSTMYYVGVEKVGQVFSKTSCQPHKDYAVNGEWTWALLAADKITIGTAREEFIKGKKNLTRHLANWDAYVSELAARNMAAQIAAKNLRIEAMKKPLVKIAAVTAWMEELPAVTGRKIPGPERTLAAGQDAVCRWTGWHQEDAGGELRRSEPPAAPQLRPAGS